MTKIIGIGGCGNNILEYFKQQDLQDNKNNYEFISVKNIADIENINLSREDSVYSIAGFGGSIGGELTISLSEKIINNRQKVKNMVVLPFSMESAFKHAMKDIEELKLINKNIEIFPNDALSNINNKDKTMSEVFEEYNNIIFYKIIGKSQGQSNSVKGIK